MEVISWLVLMAIFILIEIATLSLTTIWFAGGALAACVAAMFELTMYAQVGVFVVVSFVILFFVRPSAVKYFNNNRIKTNYEGILGLDANVIEQVNNAKQTGIAIVNGQEWTARAAYDDMIIEAGTRAKVVNISGVKLILSNERSEIKEDKV